MIFRGMILRLRHVLVLVGILLLIGALRAWAPGVLTPLLQLGLGRRGQDGAGQAIAPGVTLWDYPLGGLPPAGVSRWLEELAPHLAVAPERARRDPVTGGNIPALDGLALDVPATVAALTTAPPDTAVAPVFRRIPARPALADLEPAPIWQGHPRRREVTLLVNVAWGNEHLPPIMAILAEQGVKTTFFLVGTWAERYPDLARAIAEAGHEIANHGYQAGERGPGNLDRDALREHILRAAQAIGRATGETTTFFSPHRGEISPHMAAVSRAAGHHLIRWSLDTVDWRDPPPEVMVKRVLDGLHGGALILMHPRAVTVRALPDLLQGLGERGYRVVPLSTLLSPAPPAYLYPLPPRDYPGPPSP